MPSTTAPGPLGRLDMIMARPTVARPALAGLAVLVLIGSWNNLMWAFIALRSENMQTMPLLVYLLQGETRTPFGLIMAVGLIATVPLFS